MAYTPRVLSLNTSITDAPNETRLEDAACAERPLSLEVGNGSFENLWLRVDVGDDEPAFSALVLGGVWLERSGFGEAERERGRLRLKDPRPDGTEEEKGAKTLENAFE